MKATIAKCTAKKPVPSAAPTANFTAVLQLTLPPHAVPGETFEVLAGNQIIRVQCPRQFRAGKTVRIRVPAHPIAPQHEDETPGVRRLICPVNNKHVSYMVTVPPGVEPGETFPVKIEGQPEVRVKCPAFASPGTSLRYNPPPLTAEAVREEIGEQAAE